jgi:hypothetical protein
MVHRYSAANSLVRNRSNVLSQLVTERFNRSEKILERAVSRGILSENGKAALTAALDPFHDQQISHLRGWPDLETQPSVVRCVRQSTTIKAANAGGSIMIYTWPILNQANTNQVVRRNAVIDEIIVEPGFSDFLLGPVTVRQYTGTENMTLNAGTYAWHSYLDADYLLDSCRLIGMGVEVYDVTAEIYKQGTITCFHVPQSTNEPEVAVVKQISEATTKNVNGVTKRVKAPAVTILPTGVTFLPLKKYPSSLASIMQIEGTRQWAAKDGAYTVIPFHSRDNFPGQPVYTTPALYVDSLNIPHEEVEFLNTAPFNIGPWALPQVADDFMVFLSNKFVPVHSKGILLSGLNENSTFTINVVYYLESFPAVDNLQLVTLARPSAALDEMALEMISVATQQLPIAVPVAMNGLGDWFAEAVSEIAPYVSALGSGLGLTPLTAIADASNKMAKDYMAGPKYENTGGFFAPKKSQQLAPPRAKNPQKQQANQRLRQAQSGKLGKKQRAKKQRELQAAIDALKKAELK